MKKNGCVECTDGTKVWWVNEKLHRTDGPAIEYDNGYKAWYLNGKRHRIDGPAIEYADGSKEWWVNGVSMTEEEFNYFKNQLYNGGNLCL